MIEVEKKFEYNAEALRKLLDGAKLITDKSEAAEAAERIKQFASAARPTAPPRPR